MKTQRIVALVVGCLLLLPGLGVLFGGGALSLAYAFARNDNGNFEVNLPQLQSQTAAIIATGPVLTSDVERGGWLSGSLAVDIRLRVDPASSDTPMFVGIGPAAEVQKYLQGVAHDEIVGFTDNGLAPIYRTSSGAAAAEPPATQNFWTAQGSDELNWRATDGRWAVVIMNADGTSGINTTAMVEVRAGFVLPLALILLFVGVVLTVGAVVLIVVGASGGRRDRLVGVGPAEPAGTVPDPTRVATADHPVVVTAYLEPGLSRWKWLVKWVLAIPHLIVLAFLWPVFIVVTIIAGFAILFTGTYPPSLFEFNRGVLRWSWRVTYYAFNGGMGTDRYPPFTLGAVPDYPATLDIAYPARLSRGLVLVKWWLLAIPHYLILGLLVTNWWGWFGPYNDRFTPGPAGSGGVLGLLVLIALIVLLFTAAYPRPLFDLIVGLNRWIFRVIAYVALMTDTYPPFQLDQGGTEPAVPGLPIPRSGPAFAEDSQHIDTRAG